ncbi:cell envelope integrity protein TolA [Xanthomonas albilineans]|uniref:Probable biopolymer transport protein n=1 Tax=Xanthomonas albilineans (strain GPE PC73 / CFBP 7063) TaxID=380358 RepID=D2U9H4_XANAP|nr:cell envelope integrity protein TolA [Xanthomonas albilineans]PPU93626.1 protein TolA [Xanthomonas albilineans]QHQ29139.1 putative biopolymer transport protein [Xanthomonas albilineans]CBA16903.1 probable biopolymer transport protein [Xanthomonas albilineans GPE PC73]
MHADVDSRPPRLQDDGDGLIFGIALALAVHVLIALLLYLAWWWSPVRQVEPAAGSPMVEAALVVSASDVRSAQKAVQDAPKPLPEPLPEPVKQVAEEDTVPPPQPIPVPKPQQAPTPQQQKAQDFIPVPDKVDQERATRAAISQEKEKQEQEAKRRQEQIDLTEQKRQQEAEQKQRLAAQQEEQRQQKIAEIRKQREKLDREAQLTQQKLRQIADLSAKQAAAAATNTPQEAPGQNGNNTDLQAKYAAAIQQAVLSQWVRPDSVPLGQKCKIAIRQIVGGQVIEAKVSPDCPYDEAGRRSIEAAVLRAQPLPYHGFESVFTRDLTFNFTAQDR